MKIWKMTPFAVAPLIMAMCLPVAAPAAQPDHSQLPEDAKWVIHVDLKALSQTELAQEARAERPQMTQLVRRWLQDNLGVDPREDLDSLTLFSNSYDQYTGTMILKANYDKDKVQAAIEERPDIHKEQWEGLTLYTITGEFGGFLGTNDGPQRTDVEQAAQERAAQAAAGERPEGQSMTVALVDGNKVVVASSPERAKDGVRLAKGDASTLAEDSPLLAEASEDALLYGAAIDLEQIEQREGIFPILKQHERAYWTICNANGEVSGKLKLHAVSEEVAEQMKTALEGSVAFSRVWAGESENLQKLMENREVSRDGKVVELTGHGDAQTVRESFNELRNRLEQRVQATVN